MAHAAGHAASALLALACGEPMAALGCVLPDLAWLPVEARLRRSRLAPLDYIATVTDEQMRVYRAAHSLFAPALAFAFGSPALALGLLVHLALDAPLHTLAPTRWRPFWPLSQWRWPWVWQWKKFPQ